MADMNTEHEALKIKMQQQEEDRLRLALTGPNNGRPVYFEKSMRDGHNVDDIPLWKVTFENNDDHNTNTVIPNFVATVAGLEFRLGDIVVFPFNTVRQQFVSQLQKLPRYILLTTIIHKWDLLLSTTTMVF